MSQFIQQHAVLVWNKYSDFRVSIYFTQYATGEWKIDAPCWNVLKQVIGSDTTRIRVVSHISDPDGLNQSKLLAELIKAYVANNKLNLYLELELPYVPGCRSDRETADELFPQLMITAEVINSMKFDRVIIHDVHSNETLAAINHSVVRDDTYDRIAQMLRISCVADHICIVAPDQGAEGRAHKLANSLIQYSTDDHQQISIVTIEKERIADGVTFHGTSNTDHVDTTGHTLFIVVDDICDGGRTHLQAADMIRTQFPQSSKTLLLAVVNGFFSRDDTYNLLSNSFDHIFALNTWKKK